METTRIQNGKTERIEAFFLNSSGAGATGGTPTLKIRRRTDNYFFNGTTFQAAVTTVNMTEVSAANDAGKYFYSFNTAGLADDDYFITASLASGVNSPQFGELKVGGYVNFIDLAISTVRLSIPLFNTAGKNSAESVWTKKEKDEVLKKVRLILDLTTKIEATENPAVLEAQKQIKEKIGETAGEVIAVVLKEVAALAEDQGKSIQALKEIVQSYSESKIIQASQEIGAQLIEKMESQVKLIEKINAETILSDILKKISLVEQITIKQTPTEILEGIQSENPDK